MAWFYSTKYWKHNTDIFPDNIKRKFLEFREGFSGSIRKYYPVSRKAILYRRIYKDFINLAIEKVAEGNLVSLNHGITLYLKDKSVPVIAFDDEIDNITSDGTMPYIFMNTGEIIKSNQDYMIIPSKNVRFKLKKFKASGKKATKLLSKYYK